MAAPLRLAMWSGPRNISTAMMRSWGNRPDTVVCDEPFYAHYLSVTGRNHPGASEIIAKGETDPRKVIDFLIGEIPDGKSIFYQKHMAHHLLPGISRDWLGAVSHCFLIRHPAEVITSYLKKNSDLTLEDLGFVQQIEIFDCVREHYGLIPPVLDAKDVLQNPERMLRLLCNALGVEFSEMMLSWPPGPRETDGVWAKYWYAEVMNSTSFHSYQPKENVVPERLREIHDQCRECYERLYENRLH